VLTSRFIRGAAPKLLQSWGVMRGLRSFVTSSYLDASRLSDSSHFLSDSSHLLCSIQTEVPPALPREVAASRMQEMRLWKLSLLTVKNPVQ
jgi:hypothetical protein